jgi:type II secretory pathway pseudopilin PulG
MMNLRTKKGFTIIELMLAMSFLAVLLITIAILTIRIVSIYQKGLTIRAISSTGRQLIDDFTRSVATAQIVDTANRESYFIEKTDNIDIDNDGNSEPGVQLFGAFCTGSFSYLWNTGYAINSDEESLQATYTYSIGAASTTVTDFRILKISDSERDICSKYTIKKNHNPASPDLRKFTGTDIAPLELLDESEDRLSIYDMRVLGAISNSITGHSFYASTFTLATLRGGVDIFAQGDYCRDVPDGLNTDFNYCAINKFNFAMRATGENKDENREDVYGER